MDNVYSPFFDSKEGSSDAIKDPLLRPLWTDMCKCEELMQKHQDEFSRRTYVRASFAFLEGFLFIVKKQFLQWLIQKGMRDNNLEISKIELLGDLSLRAGRTGKIESESNRMPFLNYCALILRTGAECVGMEPAAIFSDNGWMSLQKALAVRHRITHPKQPSDLDVSLDDVMACNKSIRWLYNSLIDLMSHGAESGNLHFNSDVQG